MAGKKKDWKPKWYPSVDFLNKVGGEKVDFRNRIFTMQSVYGDYIKHGSQFGGWKIDEKVLGFDPRMGYWIRVRYEASMTFAEELELESFPF